MALAQELHVERDLCVRNGCGEQTCNGRDFMFRTNGVKNGGSMVLVAHDAANNGYPTCPIKPTFEDHSHMQDNINSSFFAHSTGEDLVARCASPIIKHPNRSASPEQDKVDTVEREDATISSDFVKDMSVQVYSKGLMLKVFAEIFPDGVLSEDRKKWVDLRGRRDLPRSLRHNFNRKHSETPQSTKSNPGMSIKKTLDIMHSPNGKRHWNESPELQTMGAEARTLASQYPGTPSGTSPAGVNLELPAAVDEANGSHHAPSASPIGICRPPLHTAPGVAVGDQCDKNLLSSPPSFHSNSLRSTPSRAGMPTLEIDVPTRPWEKKKSPTAAQDYAKDGVNFTTVMLRNIPNKYRRQMLLDKLDSAGFAGEYDFVYLPCDFANSCNVGYAFINFCSYAATQKFINVFHRVETKQCLTGFNSLKVCEVVPARVQGKEANIQNIQNSPLALEHLKDNPEWMPVVFAGETVEGKTKAPGQKTDGDCKTPPEWKATTSGFPRLFSPKNFSSEQASPSTVTGANAQLKSINSADVNFTTVMLRNIPNKYTRQMLCDRLNENYGKQFDFLYLPIDFVNKCNVGYAFINFRTTEAAANFIEEFHMVECSMCLRGFNSVKVCEVSAARLQGKDANIEHLKHGSVMEQIQSRPDWQPLVFDENGEIMDQIFTRPRIKSKPKLEPQCAAPTAPPPPISVSDPSETPRSCSFALASLRAEAPMFIPTPDSERMLSPSAESLRAEAPAFIPTLRTLATAQSVPSSPYSRTLTANHFTAATVPGGSRPLIVGTPVGKGAKRTLETTMAMKGKLGDIWKGKGVDVHMKGKGVECKGESPSYDWKGKSPLHEAWKGKSPLGKGKQHGKYNGYRHNHLLPAEDEYDERQTPNGEIRYAPDAVANHPPGTESPDAKMGDDNDPTKPAWAMISNIFKMGMFRGVEQFQSRA